MNRVGEQGTLANLEDNARGGGGGGGGLEILKIHSRQLRCQNHQKFVNIVCELWMDVSD